MMLYVHVVFCLDATQMLTQAAFHVWNPHSVLCWSENVLKLTICIASKMEMFQQDFHKYSNFSTTVSLS